MGVGLIMETDYWSACKMSRASMLDEGEAAENPVVRVQRSERSVCFHGVELIDYEGRSWAE